MFLLYKDFSEAKAAADQVVIMGDVNVSSLADHLMNAGGYLVADVGRPTVRDEHDVRLATFPARRWEEHLQRGDDFLDFLSSHSLHALLPEGGFATTYVP